MAIAATTEQTSSASATGGLYLSFRLGAEEYGIPILMVREIIGVMPITAVPQAPPSVRGVINLRGRVIPVADLHLVFGQPAAEQTAQTCIIVMDVSRDGQQRQVGMLVDEVAEVVTLDASQIEPAPDMGGLGRDHLLGMGLLGKRVLMLLAASELLAEVATTAT